MLQADKRLIAEYQTKVELLQDKVAGLEADLDEKEEELNHFRSTGGSRDQRVSPHYPLHPPCDVADVSACVVGRPATRMG